VEIPVASVQPQSSIASALIGGAVIGFVVIFAIVAGVLLLAGTTVVTALGFALFVAGFGGLGFGTMFGANWYVHRSGEPQ
jgi:hypothetical protein